MESKGSLARLDRFRLPPQEPAHDFGKRDAKYAERLWREAATVGVIRKGSDRASIRQHVICGNVLANEEYYQTALRHYRHALAITEALWSGKGRDADFVFPGEPVYTGTDGGHVEDAERNTAQELTKPAGNTRENTGGVGARLLRELSPDQIAAVLEESPLGHAMKRYEKQLREIELPAGGFTSKEQADAGARLAQTLRDLQNVQAGLGIATTEAPERVKEAERMAGAYRRTHDERGAFIPPRPRGRPRRVVQEPATASVG